MCRMDEDGYDIDSYAEACGSYSETTGYYSDTDDDVGSSEEDEDPFHRYRKEEGDMGDPSDQDDPSDQESVSEGGDDQ